MRLVMLPAFLVFCFSGVSYSFTALSQNLLNKKVSIQVKNESVKQVLRSLEKETGASFIYSPEIIRARRKVNFEVKNTTLRDVLNLLLKDENVIPQNNGGQIILIKKPSDDQQTIHIKGKVTDESGKPLAGVTVAVMNTTIGTTTNQDGDFTLDVPEKALLQISSIGYETMQVPVNGETSIQVKMKLSASSLQEVIVVGYGTEKKSQLIGSVSQINAKDIDNRSVPQLSQVIQGQMPGVTAIETSGQPGASGESITIRGIGSFGASTAPLILEDGIPISSMDNIDPNNVQSISVLKDASSAAIYGARAANGVILITTKSGSEDHKLHVSYNGYVSTQRATAYPKMVSSWQFAELSNEAEPGSYTQAQIDSFRLGTDPFNYPNTNWVNMVFKKSTLQTGQNISLANSTKNTDYFLSFGYLYQNGIVVKNNYNRYNIRLNMTNRISKRLTLISHLSGEQDIDREPAPPATLDWNNMLSSISQVIRVPAIYPNKMSNGDWGTGIVNKGTPVSYFDNASFFTSKGANIMANERLDWKIIDGLKASLIGGYTENNMNSQRFLASQTINANIILGPGNLTQSSNTSYYKTLQELLQYNKTFNKSSFTLLLGHSFEDSYVSSSSEYRGGFNSNQLTQINAGDVSTQTNSGTASEWALDSYFGRLQYSFADKYLIEGDIRHDGSSRFPTDKKYATFPAVAVGWRISRENFIKNNAAFDWLNDLKFKASYGTLGNQNIGNYPFQDILSPGYNYPIGGNIAPGVAVTTLTDSLLHWESTRTKDIGLDASLLNNKISFGVTYFDKYTYDILISPAASVSQVLGFGVGPQNSGKLDNRGWEFNIEHKNKIGEFSYQVNANFSIINNKVIDLGVGNVKQPNGLIGNGSSLFIGYPVNVYYGYVADGLFTNQAAINKAPDQTAVNPNPQPGDVEYKDISGPGGKLDGKVTPAYDQTILGSSFPKYTYGLNIGMNYKNLSLNILFQGVAGVKGYLNNMAGWAFYNTASVQVWQMKDRWTPSNPNPHAKYPRMQIVPNSGLPNYVMSSYWLINGSYLRVKSVQLGYIIPEKLLHNAGISSLRVYASAENFLTFSHYPQGWDPEINTGGIYYPILANYTLGVNLNF